MTTQTKKFILKLGLFLITLLGLGLSSSVHASAATLNPVSTDKSVYLTQSPGTLVPNSKTSGTQPTSFPKLESVSANNLSSTNRVTNKTDTISLKFSGTLSMPTSTSAQLSSVKVDAMTTGGKSVTGVSSQELLVGNTRSLFFAATHALTITLDLSDIRMAIPMYLGFTLKSTDGTTTTHYTFAELTNDVALQNSWGSLPTITSATPDNVLSSSQIKSTATSISGKAVPGLTVWVTLVDHNNNAVTIKTTADADGHYTLKFPQPLGKLSDSTIFNIYESNEMGDTGFTTSSQKNVQRVLTIDLTTPNIDVYPDDLTANVTGKSDQEILNWLVKQAGISVTNLGDPVANSDLTFSADKTNLASLLAGLSDGQSTDIAISATEEVDGRTIPTDGSVTVTVTKKAGTFKFGEIAPLNFGVNAVPTQETLIAPNATKVMVNDTQAVGTNWYITASASPLISTDGHTLNGLVYVDADGNQEKMTDQNVLVASGQRASGTSSFDAASDWATTDNGKKTGIYFKAKPTTYSGPTSTHYTGTVTWTLSNTPSTN